MTATLALREYQTEALDALDADWAAGLQRVAVVLPTGMGKTVVFAELARRALAEGRRVVVLVHREELAQQAADKLRMVVPEGTTVGVVKAERDEVGADVVVASVPTLARERRMGRYLAATAGARRLVVVDECFPAGTKVGGVPIQQLRPGDLVPSWDEVTGREVWRPVIRVMRRTPSAMVRVRFADGGTVACTPNHPFLTSSGWVPAGMLRDEQVISFTHDANASIDDLHGVRTVRVSDHEAEDRRLASLRPGVLHAGASGRVGAGRPLGADGADEPYARLGADDGTQPDARPSHPGEDGGFTAPGRAPAPRTWWQRLAGAVSTAGVGRLSRLAGRGHDHAGRRPAAVSLQCGHRASDDAGLRRGGRGIPFRAGSPVLRPAKGRTVVGRRVVNVQVLEPGRDGTYGGVCPDGAVYNVEVDGTHTYLIDDGTVVHNCHHAAARTWVEVLEALGGFAGPDGSTIVAGFTATMSREDGRGLGDIWQKVSYTRDILYGIDHGYLTDVRGKAVTVDGLDLGTVARSRGDYQEGQLGEALEASGAGEVIADAYLEHAKDRPGVLFAPTVATAQSFADDLNAAGIATEVITGATSTEDRAAIYTRFRDGRTQVLSNCMVLTEGWDAPWCSTAVIARPTRSAGLYTQMVGRVLRPFPGKVDALVLDVVGVAQRHALRSIVDLTTTAVQREDGESLAEAIDREARARDRRPAAKGRAEGLIAAADVDLFHRSTSVWLQTEDGKWFIPTKDWTFFLWPEAGGTTWKVGRIPTFQAQRRDRTLRGGWVRENLEFGYAMAFGEAEAAEVDSTVSTKGASWRKRKAPPSDAQVGMMASWGIPVTEGMTKSEASDAISVKIATKDLSRFKLEG